MEPLKYEFQDWRNHYSKLVGDTPFNNAVNKLIGDYWVETGDQMPLEDAMFAVLADHFNKTNPTVNK